MYLRELLLLLLPNCAIEVSVEVVGDCCSLFSSSSSSSPAAGTAGRFRPHGVTLWSCSWKHNS
jgi:hypothetical protein